jgi:hypothetical protein
MQLLISLWVDLISNMLFTYATENQFTEVGYLPLLSSLDHVGPSISNLSHLPRGKNWYIFKKTKEQKYIFVCIFSRHFILVMHLAIMCEHCARNICLVFIS